MALCVRLYPSTSPRARGSKSPSIVHRPAFSPEEFLTLARAVYEGLTDEEIDDIEKSFHRPMSMFGDRDPDRFSD